MLPNPPILLFFSRNRPSTNQLPCQAPYIPASFAAKCGHLTKFGPTDVNKSHVMQLPGSSLKGDVLSPRVLPDGGRGGEQSSTTQKMGLP